MDKFIYGPKPYLLLSTTCDAILSWMIEIWIRNHLGSDGNCNIVNLYCPQKNSQEVTNDVGLTFSVGDTTPQFTISIGQENKNWWHGMSHISAFRCPCLVCLLLVPLFSIESLNTINGVVLINLVSIGDPRS